MYEFRAAATSPADVLHLTQMHQGGTRAAEPVIDLQRDRDRLGQVFERPADVAELVVNDAESVQDIRLALQELLGALDRQGLLSLP